MKKSNSAGKDEYRGKSAVQKPKYRGFPLAAETVGPNNYLGP